MMSVISHGRKYWHSFADISAVCVASGAFAEISIRVDEKVKHRQSRPRVLSVVSVLASCRLLLHARCVVRRYGGAAMLWCMSRDALPVRSSNLAVRGCSVTDAQCDYGVWWGS